MLHDVPVCRRSSTRRRPRGCGRTAPQSSPTTRGATGGSGRGRRRASASGRLDMLAGTPLGRRYGFGTRPVGTRLGRRRHAVDDGAWSGLARVRRGRSPPAGTRVRVCSTPGGTTVGDAERRAPAGLAVPMPSGQFEPRPDCSQHRVLATRRRRCCCSAIEIRRRQPSPDGPVLVSRLRRNVDGALRSAPAACRSRARSLTPRCSSGSAWAAAGLPPVSMVERRRDGDRARAIRADRR